MKILFNGIGLKATQFQELLLLSKSQSKPAISPRIYFFLTKVDSAGAAYILL